MVTSAGGSEAESFRPPSVPPGLERGRVIAGKYELVRKLGAGSMGEVWAAQHLSLHEEVAIKLVMRDVEHDDGTSAEERFLFEARIAATLSRKTRHIVGVTDHGDDGDMAYLVMELLAGESLDARLRRTGPLPLEKAAAIVSQIARGLSVAHAEGILHRDLKPSNVFVTVDEDGKALLKLLDFGIAKMRGSMRKVAVRELASTHATMHGFLLGTPAFMSPEQARGKRKLDHRVDVWALGVIAYHLLTGELPFDGDGVEALLARLTAVIPTPIRDFRSELPPAVERFFERAFHEKIDKRFQSAASLANAFEQLEPAQAGAIVSLPPPPPPRTFEDLVLPLTEKKSSSTIHAAGVPRKGAAKRAGIALLSVLAVVALTAAVLGIYFEREPAPAPAALVASDPPRQITPPPSAPPEAEPLPPLPPARPVELPPASPSPVVRALHRPPAPPPPRAAEPAPTPSPPVEEPAGEKPRTLRAHDRSDVF